VISGICWNFKNY